MTDEVLAQLMELILKHRDRIDHDVIFRGVKWA